MFSTEDMPNGTFELPIVPAVVCLAFSIELGLKSLFNSEDSLKGSHDLEKLFNTLSQENQRKIISSVKMSQETFMNNLNLASNHFEKWRYAYEQESLDSNLNFLRTLARETVQLASVQSG